VPDLGSGLEGPRRAAPHVRDGPQGAHVGPVQHGATLKEVWVAVQNRRAMFALPPPIVGRGQFTAWTERLGSVMATPLCLKLPISRAMIVDLLEALPASTREVRDKLLAVVATSARLRVS
jgi:hypothetical protein